MGWTVHACPHAEHEYPGQEPRGSSLQVEEESGRSETGSFHYWSSSLVNFHIIPKPWLEITCLKVKSGSIFPSNLFLFRLFEVPCAIHSLRCHVLSTLSVVPCAIHSLKCHVLSALSEVPCAIHSLWSAMCFPLSLWSAMCYPLSLKCHVLSTLSKVRCAIHSLWSAMCYPLHLKCHVLSTPSEVPCAIHSHQNLRRD